MSLKVVDELMTPGCPQCAIKHLSAALYYRAEGFAIAKQTPTGLFLGQLPPTSDRVLLARAYINLGEVLIGYKSHLWFAVGLLQRSEEESRREGGEGAVAREARLILEQKGLDGAREAMQAIRGGTLLCAAEMEVAHMQEARRELPEFSDPFYSIVGAIERIREEFFNLPPSTVPGGEETTQTEKEPDMATAKKTAPKGAKCAAKGGKTAKATKCACKGGKTAKAKK